MPDQLTAQVVPASQHPDYCVRKAEDIGTVLNAMIQDLHHKRVTVETFAASLQHFSVKTLREVAAWQREEDAKLMETKFHKVSRYPQYHPKYDPTDMYSPYAEAIRAQSHQQKEEPNGR